jgi:endonuclease-3
MKRKEKIHPAIYKLMEYYEELQDIESYEWLKWSDKRKRFSEKRANIFIVSLLLDQGQRVEYVEEKSEYLVNNFFKKGKNWWKNILREHYKTVARICKTGFNGGSFALNYQTNKFPKWLRSAAKKIVDDYDGDVRNIWNNIKDPQIIYDRLKEFDGIGDALAKMGQFILVRQYGLAGGISSRALMSVKPDIHVRRVVYRTGIAKSEKTNVVVETFENLDLKSPADIDAALWEVGRKYCKPRNPKCDEESDSCPLNEVCSFNRKKCPSD